MQMTFERKQGHMTTLKPQVWGSGGRAMIMGNYKLVQMTAQDPNRNGLRTVRNVGMKLGAMAGYETQNGELKQWE